MEQLLSASVTGVDLTGFTEGVTFLFLINVTESSFDGPRKVGSFNVRLN